VRNILFVFALLALGASAFADGFQITGATIDVAMRGNTLVADPGIPGAWIYNPAALASLAGLKSDAPTGKWRHEASVTAEVKGDADAFALNWGGVETGKDFGLGAGYAKAWDAKVYGAGFGKTWGAKSLSWGVSWQHASLDFNSVVEGQTGSTYNYSEDQNLITAGVLGELSSLNISGISNVRWGAVLRDATDQWGRTWDLGLAFDAPSQWHVCMDLADLSDEVDRRFRIGATHPLDANKEWTVGVGLDSGNATAGVIYNPAKYWQGGSWRFGAAWEEVDEGANELLLGAYGNWGL
jgi:hypothetical protein